MKRTTVAALSAAVLLMAGNAHAVDFQFYVSNVMSAHDCPVGNPGCSSDIIANSLDYLDTGSGIGVNVTSGVGTDVIADYAPAFGGLGALIEGQAEEFFQNPDNLVDGQSLTFDFTEAVTLFSAEHFNSVHVNTFATGPDYELFVDGTSFGSFEIDAGVVAFSNATGQVFRFEAINGGDPFYVSGLSFSASIPEPATALLVGMGLVGLGATRRQLNS